MSNLEHYFENLLYRGQDVSGDVNKNALTADKQNAVEVCAAYVKYTMCGGDAALLDAILHDNVEPVRHGRWEYIGGRSWRCSECEWIHAPNKPKYNYCPICGTIMDGGTR